MRKKSTPGYLLHKPTGQARVRINGRDFYLGKYDSPESRQKYHQLVAEWLSSNTAPAEPGEVISVNELLAAYLGHVEVYYVNNGQPTKEQSCIKLALRPVRELYGSDPAGEFGPRALKAVRAHLIDKGHCRTAINRTVGRIKRAFKWGVEQELVPPAVFQGLQAMRGLVAGRSAAEESKPVKPVDRRHVEAVLPHVTPHVAAMIQVQLLTGMRPGELLSMRVGDLAHDRRGLDLYPAKPQEFLARPGPRDLLGAPGPSSDPAVSQDRDRRLHLLATRSTRAIQRPAKGKPQDADDPFASQAKAEGEPQAGAARSLHGLQFRPGNSPRLQKS